MRQGYLPEKGWFIRGEVHENKRQTAQKYLKTLPEARNWLEDAGYEEKHRDPFVNTYMTVDEQKRFLKAARRSHNYYQYALIPETGLRTGEPAKNGSYDTHLYTLCEEAGK